MKAVNKTYAVLSALVLAVMTNSSATAAAKKAAPLPMVLLSTKQEAADWAQAQLQKIWQACDQKDVKTFAKLHSDFEVDYMLQMRSIPRDKFQQWFAPSSTETAANINLFVDVGREMLPHLLPDDESVFYAACMIEHDELHDLVTDTQALKKAGKAGFDRKFEAYRDCLKEDYPVREIQPLSQRILDCYTTLAPVK